jgi:hypothetical protein
MTIRAEQPPLSEIFLGGLMILAVVVLVMWTFRATSEPVQLDCSPADTYIE